MGGPGAEGTREGASPGAVLVLEVGPPLSLLLAAPLGWHCLPCPTQPSHHLRRSSLVARQCCASRLCISSWRRRSSRSRPCSCARSWRSLLEACSSCWLLDSCSRSLVATACDNSSCRRSSCPGQGCGVSPPLTFDQTLPRRMPSGPEPNLPGLEDAPAVSRPFPGATSFSKAPSSLCWHQGCPPCGPQGSSSGGATAGL